MLLHCLIGLSYSQDPLVEDGLYGPNTHKKLLSAPRNGFARDLSTVTTLHKACCQIGSKLTFPSFGFGGLECTRLAVRRGWRSILISDCMVDTPGSFSFRGPGGNWLLLFNCRCGVLLDPGMANMWRRGGNIRYDSSDGRSLAVIVPCAGRGVRGRVLSLVSVYGPVSGSGFDANRRVMFDELSVLLSKTFLPGALYWEFREFMEILTTFLEKKLQKSIITRVFRPFVRIIMGSLLVFPRKVIRIRMNSRNSQCNAPGKEVSNW